MNDFAADSVEWYNCVVSRMILDDGTERDADIVSIALAQNECPARPQTTPSVPILALSNFAASAVAMVPGLIFAKRCAFFSDIFPLVCL